MVYSSKLKGALCKFCIVFKPTVKRGVLGSFIIKEFSNYKKLHESAKAHQNSEWHKQSVFSASHFINIVSGKHVNVIEQINTHERETLEKNREKLKSIVSTILFWGTIALRGKQSHEGNFNDLLRFRVESGDTDLGTLLETCHTKHKYTSVQIQNNLIEIAGGIIRQRIVSEVNDSEAFSILADETADISGHEHLSLGVRKFDEHNILLREYVHGSRVQFTFTRTKANNFLTSVSNPLFLICLKIISRYYATLEPVTNKLQGIYVNLLSVKTHIDELVFNFQSDREDSEKTFSQMFKEVEEIGKTLDVEIKMPRTVVPQTHRSNIPATSAEQYFRLNIFNPYLDSLIMSLKLKSF
nr:unnamed protein product [Callosobruchus analis]